MKALDPRLLRLVPLGATATGLLSLLRALLAVTQCLLLAHVLAQGFHGVAVTLLWLGSVLALRGAAAALQDVVSRRTSAAAKRQLREQVLTHMTQLGPRWLSRQRSGEAATLLGAGAESLDGFFSQYLPQLALAGLVPLAVLVSLVIADWPSAVIVGATLPLVPLFLALVGLHTKKQTAHQWRQLSQLGGHFLDVVQGLPTLRVFGRAQAQVHVLRRITDEHRRATVRTLRTAFLSALVLEMVATLSVAVLAVSVGFRLLAGELDLETALLVLLLAPEAFLPLRAVGTAFHAALDGVSAAESAFSILAEPLPSRTNGRRTPSTVQLSLEKVTVREHDRTSLRSFDLHVEPGDLVALEGPSGAGKSTVLGLFLGVVLPTTGRVLVDGLDLRELSLERWRSQVGWVPQTPHLFARSVAENIRLGLPDASDREVRDAARAAFADEFIEALPRGYDTVLGEGGAGLSVGQQRRLAVARAFLRNAPLLLLDEPTAGLDADSEAAVAASLDRLCHQRTVVLATHRLDIVTSAYRVIELGSRV